MNPLQIYSCFAKSLQRHQLKKLRPSYLLILQYLNLYMIYAHAYAPQDKPDYNHDRY